MHQQPFDVHTRASGFNTTKVRPYVYVVDGANAKQPDSPNMMSIQIDITGAFTYYERVLNPEINDEPELRNLAASLRCRSVRQVWGTNDYGNIENHFSEFGNRNNRVAASTDMFDRLCEKIGNIDSSALNNRPNVAGDQLGDDLNEEETKKQSDKDKPDDTYQHVEDTR